MTNWAKVVTCLHRFVHFSYVRTTRRPGISETDTEFSGDNFQLLEPRLLLSSAGMLPAPDLPRDDPSGMTAAIVANDPSGQVPADHLVMHLQFDDSMGRVAQDSSPHGGNNAGVLRNGASFTVDDGPLGSSVILDGADDFVRVKNSRSLNLGTHAKRTVAAWFKIHDVSSSDRTQVIYEEGGRRRGLNIYVHDGTLYVGGWNSPRRGWAGTYISTDAIESGTWHHIALVLNGKADTKQVQDDALVAYLDGTEFGRGQGAKLQRHPGGIGIGGTNGRTLLHDGASGRRPQHGFEGQITDIRVYNRPLRNSEITVLASQRSATDVTTELNFVPDPGIRLEGGTVPEAGIDPDTGTVYLYYRIGPNGYVATTNDGGLDFPGDHPLPMKPGNKAFDPRCVQMPDTDQDGEPVWREFLWDRDQGYFTSLISGDGVHYQPEEGVRYDPPDTEHIGVYTAYTTDGGRVGLMYIGDKGTTRGNVRLAYSTDNGRSFQHYDGNPLHDAGAHDEGLNQRDPDAIVLDDGRIRIFTMVQGGPLAPHPGVRSVTSIYSFTSADDGQTFTEDPGPLLNPEDFTEFDVWSLNDPSVIQLSDGRYRMYVAGLISTLPDASDVHWVILSATTTMEDDSGGTDSIQLDHVSTHEMDMGTHRPEMLATESGQLIAVVVQPGIQEDGSLAKHRVYHIDADGNTVGDPFAVTWSTDEYGEPADHRAAIVDDELVIVYQSLEFDQDRRPGTAGPAEQYASNQSLMLARYSLDGTELFRGPIVAHVTDFSQDNFPDHCLVPLDDSLLISTGSKDQIKFREVSYQGQVLNTYEFSTSKIRSLSSIGNSMLVMGGRIWMFAASGTQPGGSSGISVLELDSEFQPTELAWFSQDGEERTFPTGSLQHNDYTFVTYDVRDEQDRPVGPEGAPFQPRLMVLDEELNLVADIDIGSGVGFAHVHPTLAVVKGDLVVGWSMKAGDADRRTPQVQLERYSLRFMSDEG